MKIKGIIRYYTGLLDGFFSYYIRVARSQEKEDIHQLRVQIKRLRALWSLADVLLKGAWDKQPCFEEVAPLFRKAGLLREYQILRELSSSLPAGIQYEYRAYLDRNERVAGLKLARAISNFDQRSFTARCSTLRPSLESLSESEIMEKSFEFLHSREIKIRKLRRRLPDNRRLHKIRIELKVAHEVLTILGQISASEGIHHERSQIKALNAALGDWHDQCEFLESLMDFRRTNPQPSLGDPWTVLTKRLEKKQKKRQDKLLLSLDTYLEEQERFSPHNADSLQK